MSEFDDQIDVTPGPGASYNVFSGFSKDTLSFTAGGLLNLANWIEHHRDELTAQVNGLGVSEAERYNREMDARNRIIAENRDKPWLPFHDGE